MMREWDGGRGDGMIALREYRETDLEAIYALDQQCFARAFQFSRSSMRDYAEAENAISLIAEAEGGELAGFVIADVEEWEGTRWGYVVTLDVAEGYRRKGLAGRLMTEVERRVLEEGGETMLLHVHTENVGAVTLYEKRGYVRVQVSRNFYGRTKEGAGRDAYVYRKVLKKERG